MEEILTPLEVPRGKPTYWTTMDVEFYSDGKLCGKAGKHAVMKWLKWPDEIFVDHYFEGYFEMGQS